MNKKIILILVVNAMILATGYMAVAHDNEAPTIDDTACRMLAEYDAPNEDISADYKPGVDVNGNPVVEADLSPSPVQVPENFEFDITVDIAKYSNLNIPTGTEGHGKIGTVRMKDGKLFFNDSPLEGQSIAALRALCDQNTEETSEKNTDTNE